MRIKNAWQGIKVEMLGNTQGPLHYKQRFEGATEDTKVLVLDEQTNIEHVSVTIGGFAYEIEMSVEESIQQIKNAKDICALVRDEITNFVEFFPQIMAKVEAVAAEANKTTSAPAEEAPVAEEAASEATPSFVQSIVAKVMAEIGKPK